MAGEEVWFLYEQDEICSEDRYPGESVHDLQSTIGLRPYGCGVDQAVPSGAMVAVFSESPEGRRYLLLHNCEKQTGKTGDWVWGCPSGRREAGEDIGTCAARELWEETGIRADPTPVATQDIGWAVFCLQVPWGTPVMLAPDEHNAFGWFALDDESSERLLPELQAASFRLAVEAIEIDL